MDKRRVSQIKEQFDLIIRNEKEADIEFWYARELMPLLGYERWENFDKAICRAIISCETSEIEVEDHFREVTKMVTLGSGAQRAVKDYMLTRYACYLIAQNGDPKKEEFLGKVMEFNVIRNNANHKMRKSNLEKVSKSLEKAKGIFDEIYNLYDEIEDDFRAIFHSFKKRCVYG